MKRIVITGVGCISALGNKTSEFTDKLFNGVSGIAAVERVKVFKARTKIAAEVKNFDAAEHFTATQISQMDRHSLFAIMATREAVADAGIEFSPSLAERTAISYGTGIGGQNTQDEGYYRLYAEDAKRLHPYPVPKLMPSAAASHISMAFGITGPSLTTTTACASSAHSMGVAMMMLRSGMVDVAITGGAEAPITASSFLAWEGLRVLSKDGCSPFSAKRGGLVLGEGAGTLILETLEHAQQRGAKIYAELAGFGMCSDAHNLVQPLEDGMARAMKLALKDANLAPTDIAYINAHGTGTPQNDPVETAAIRAVFEDHADNLLVSSSKSMHGHILGASSAVEAIATIAAITQQCAPPTMGFIETDPACDLDYVFGQSRPQKIEAALSNSFAFGGLNAVLAFKRFG
ncbi:MAG: beta-ketoacyl-[acyl-carrier-protein] synthase family protein [Pseudomonadales bacterium]|nr:beta-ketoacyl-[acyl-carrier-protein] synthase family protein [Pseudomonadales bacterium]